MLLNSPVPHEIQLINIRVFVDVYAISCFDPLYCISRGLSKNLGVSLCAGFSVSNKGSATLHFLQPNHKQFVNDHRDFLGKLYNVLNIASDELPEHGHGLISSKMNEGKP